MLNGLRDGRPVTRGGEERREEEEEERKKGETRIKKGRNAKDERGENRLVVSNDCVLARQWRG